MRAAVKSLTRARLRRFDGSTSIASLSPTSRKRGFRDLGYEFRLADDPALMRSRNWLYYAENALAGHVPEVTATATLRGHTQRPRSDASRRPRSA